jgi:hypothetical protein
MASTAGRPGVIQHATEDDLAAVRKAFEKRGKREGGLGFDMLNVTNVSSVHTTGRLRSSGRWQTSGTSSMGKTTSAGCSGGIRGTKARAAYPHAELKAGKLFRFSCNRRSIMR